jgi:hypothetical protein
MENEPTERLRFRSPVASSDKGERMPLPACVDAIDWTAVRAALDTQGWAVVPGLLDEEEAKSIAGLYARDEGFRSRVVMARHGFGRGEYRYFSYPLPDPIAAIRTAAYPYLVPIANDWHARMKRDDRFPPDHAAFLHDAMRRGRGGRRRFCWNMAPATIIACIGTSMAIMCSRSRWRCCSTSPEGILKAANS